MLKRCCRWISLGCGIVARSRVRVRYCLKNGGRSRFLFGSFVGVLLCSIALLYAQTNPQERGVVDTAQPAAQNQKHGAYYALVIGIGNYEQEPVLKTPVNDAKEVAGVLKDQYGFDIRTLLDKDATRDQIFQALDHYRTSLGEDDNLLIYFGGHGLYKADLDQAYWAPVDAGKDSYAHWITATDITSEARAIPARHVLIISDSCYSGMLTREARGPDATRKGSGSDATSEDRSKYLDQMRGRKSRNVMSSGADEPVLDGDAPGHFSTHSVFANVLLESLDDNRQNQFTGQELFVVVQQLVGGRSGQIPQYSLIRNSSDAGGDFIFSRNGKVAEHSSDDNDGHGKPFVRQVNSEREAVYAALDRYALAFSSMDIKQLKQAWPSMTKVQENETKRAWKLPGLKAVIVQVRNRDTIKIESSSAVIDADQWMVYTFSGTQQPPQTNSVEIQLAKNVQGVWFVDGVKGR